MRNEAPFPAAFGELAYHGGNLAAAGRLFPDAPTPWIDLSTGVNPQSYPLPALPPDVWARLPTPDELAALEAQAAQRYGADAGQVVAAPGAQALIQLLTRVAPAPRVCIFGFSYTGHAQAWRAAGVEIETIDALTELASCDVAIVVNPNNPDGRLSTSADLLGLHERLAARDGLLIVDESFMDFDQRRQSLASVLPKRGAVVLRSFGKTYGLAGLRLGFAIASPDLAPSLREGLGCWPVSGPALAIGRQALADDVWLEQARLRLEPDAARLDRLLASSGFEVVGGTILFRLARRRRAADVFVALMRHGILVRPFAEAPDRLRFGIPGDPPSWRRLAAALAAA